MNSGCAVVASHIIGSVPFLINEGENGLIYKDGNVNDLYEKVKFLLNNNEEREKISKSAYESIISEWNAENAAKKLIELLTKLLNGENVENLFKSGVCSKAKILKDNWF
jgi:glycosyltransferase involved in cell wall biosynthesis